MKTLLTLTFCLAFMYCGAQKIIYQHGGGMAKYQPLDIVDVHTLNEKSFIHKNDTKIYQISGLIEIDGHTFLNDTCSNPIKVELSLLGVKIYDDNAKYEVELCTKEKCNVLHLKEVIESRYIWMQDTIEFFEYKDTSSIMNDFKQNIKIKLL